MKRHRGHQIIIWDDILMITLAVASGIFLLLEFTTNPSVSQSLWYENADLTIATIFLVEFTIKFFLSNKKVQYLKSNWWYLLASVPITTPILQWLVSLQLLRFARLSRLIRVTTGVQEINQYIGRFNKKTYVTYSLLICLIVIFYGAIVFYFFERGANPDIATISDSILWVATAVTTVSYGGTYPTTPVGHAVGVTAMMCGIFVVVVSIALLTSFFKQGKKSRT